MSDALHIIAVAEELQRICDADLKSTLGLKAVILNDLAFQPVTTINDMVPGIWLMPNPAATNEPDEIPKVLMQKYFFRLVYVRKNAIGQNQTKKAMNDGTIIWNKLLDKIHLPDITNIPAAAQVLWIMPRSIEWSPSEDDFVARVSAELSAIAINLEVAVRTKRA